MKVIDLFAGVGGLSQGFTMAGFRVVYANEYDDSIAGAFQLNHPHTIVDTRDISRLNITKTFKPYRGKVDVVMGGPPCQGFSQKGKRVGISDERNFLFRQFLNVVKVVQPEFVILENVPNILSASNGYFKEEILNIFRSLGYEVQAKILKAENFGVPQTRRRAVFLAQRDKLTVQLPTGNGMKTSVSQAIDDLPVLASGEGKGFRLYTQKAYTEYQRLMRKGSEGVWNHVATNHSKVALERLSYIPPGGTKEDLPAHHRTKSIHSGTWSRLSPDGFARTITTRFDTPSSGQFTLPFQDRCITVREAARLQSFPDRFRFTGNKSSQMLQVGNAVPPLMAKTIAEAILHCREASHSGVVLNKASSRKKQIPVSI